MYAPHTVTLYFVTENEDYSTNVDTTILRGVFLDRTKSRGLNNTGAANADGATLFIPAAVEAVGLDGRKKQYTDPKQYRSMENPSGFWTLDPAGESSGADCFFVMGELAETLEYGEAKQRYSDTFKVSAIAFRDFGSANMRHWQVSAV